MATKYMNSRNFLVVLLCLAFATQIPLVALSIAIFASRLETLVLIDTVFTFLVVCPTYSSASKD